MKKIILSLLTPLLIFAAELDEIAKEAYIYGYPLVSMELTRQVMTNTALPGDSKAPMGQFFNSRTYPNASFKDVTTPNADTLYSFAWLDLGKEPYILHIPDMKGRYYLFPMLDGWTNVFQDPGSRTTGEAEQLYAITGPAWNGTLPEGVKEYRAPTNLVWVLGRTYSSGTPEDLKQVNELQNQYTLTPLSAYGKPYTLPKGIVNPKIDSMTAVKTQVNRLDGNAFFKLLATLLKNNPPAVDDAPTIERMKKIGIIPGEDFDQRRLSQEAQIAILKAPKAGLEQIMAYEPMATTHVNGWNMTLKTGDYGTDYLGRALVAVIGLGANLPQDAIYPYTKVDSEENPLTGKAKYVLHFPKGSLPPVNGFWSLTMYNDQFFFVDNPLNRYNINKRDNFKLNEDGSLDIYIQNNSPGAEKEANWLPAPKDTFILMLRLYWPKESVLRGTWQPPAVQKISTQNGIKK